MYNRSIMLLLEDVLAAYLEASPQAGHDSDARRAVHGLLRDVFGGGRKYKISFSESKDTTIIEEMVTAMVDGFGDALDAIIADVGVEASSQQVMDGASRFMER